MRRFSTLLLVLGLTVAFCGAAWAASPVTLRFAADEPVGSVEDIGNQAFIKEVEEKSGGRIKIEYFPSAQLGSDKQCLPSVMSGALDISFISAGNLAEFTTAMNFTDLPGIVTSPEQLRAVWQSPVRQVVSDKIFKDIGLRPIMFDVAGGAARVLFYNGKPLTSPADSVGYKFRTTGSPMEVALFKAWGIAPTPMVYSEIYTSLDQKVIDGIYVHPIGAYDQKLTEVVKNATVLNLSYIAQVKLMGKSAVAKLGGEGSELYAIVIEAGKNAELLKDKLYAERVQDIYRQLAESGLTVVQPQGEALKQWQDLARGIWPEMLKNPKIGIEQSLLDQVRQVTGGK
ncbi:TRAP transporter substrate-binding protein [Desulfovibrio sp. OttesenSCG-928-I05]|nr:TRAP transporter substrate-binding protein [Desulfovibrio sp. OttesenSCG-928-I05]